MPTRFGQISNGPGGGRVPACQVMAIGNLNAFLRSLPIWQAP